MSGVLVDGNHARLVRITFDVPAGSYATLKQALQSHNSTLPRRPMGGKLKVTTLMRSLMGSWCRDQI